MKRGIFVFVACLFLTPMASAAVIDGYTFAMNDRFANSPTFVGADYEWSGVGMTQTGRWATLIGPNTVVSANHYTPSGVIKFFAGNDPNSPIVERTIGAGERIPNTDLWMGCLNATAPSSIKVYDFATDNLSRANFSSSRFNGSTAFVVGRSAGSNSVVQDQSVGQNIVIGITEDDGLSSGLGSETDTLRLIYDAATIIDDVPNPNYVPFEAYLEVGDSGAPLFIEHNGELLLVGVNSFVTNSRISHISYIGNQADAVQHHVDKCLATIPEPSAAGALFIGAWLLAAGIRTRQAVRTAA